MAPATQAVCCTNGAHWPPPTPTWSLHWSADAGAHCVQLLSMQSVAQPVKPRHAAETCGAVQR